MSRNFTQKLNYGLRKITTSLFDLPLPYVIFQNLISKKETESAILREISSEGNDYILDFGCATGKFAKYFMNSNYLGIEPLKSCIDVAKKQYENYKNIQFIAGDHNTLVSVGSNSIDIFFAIGVMHHMTNEEVLIMSKQINRILKPGGRAIFYEPDKRKESTLVTRFLMSLDRGAMIRTSQEYENFFDSSVFKIEVRKLIKPLKIPYNSLIIRLTKRTEFN